MRISQTIDRHIEKVLRQTNEEEALKHISSGKLSASSLGKPTQWQVLHTLGVPGKEVEDYGLRVMKRGKDIEDWLVSVMPGIVETQVLINYRNVVGYIDTVIDTKDYDFSVGTIPNEIKSVKNSKFKWITSTGQPDRSHALQASLYGLAKDTKDSMVTYIAADDLRVHSFVLSVADYKQEIDQIIDKYDEAVASGVIPDLVVAEKWMLDPKWNPYPEWASLTVLEALEKLRTQFPESYKKLQERSSTITN